MRHQPIGQKELQILSRVVIFSQLPRKLLAELFDKLSVSVFDESTILFLAGDEADGFFVVLEGEVHLTALTAEGAQSLVRIVEREESFAEAAMLGLGKFPINATAQPGTVVAKVPKKIFEEKIIPDTEASLHLLSALIQRQQYLIREIKILKSLSPCQRVASYLLAIFESREWKGHGALPRCKQVIAGHIGIDPASFSRALRRLEDAGIVCEGHEVLIKDPEKLRRYCADFGYVFDQEKILMSA
ncbi:Crp/Fnr family transcriptional regulator [Kiloniella laminariae]|uniref:Crp/Fnr family transcriptional regulator n=1 Tax=Kiloniella laminariae TaxID=454162 RepID=UPI000364F5C4|nr:Crp/Fnr family transcriptional regulator [Kiloniella laminariae]